MLRTAPVTQSRNGAFRLRITAMAIACLVVGAMQSIKVNLIGEAALAELLLPVLGIAALLRPEGRRVLSVQALWWLLLAMLVTLAKRPKPSTCEAGDESCWSFPISLVFVPSLRCIGKTYGGSRRVWGSVAYFTCA
jgi:hypothetical protein